MREFRMPSLGADMEAGTLVEWLKGPGDPIAKGESVAVVETQKGAIEVEAFHDGVIARLLVEPGSKVPVGTALALIADAGATAAVPVPAPVGEAPPRARGDPRQAEAAGSAPARRRISPAARRLARERGVDLDRLPDSGAAVRSGDVLQAVSGAPAVARPKPGYDPAEMRKAIAAAMARSKREIPHYYLSHALDLAAATAWLERENARRSTEERVLLGAVLLKATALAIREFPEVNGYCEAGVHQPSEAIHLGVAISLRGGGLVAPALHQADQRGLGDLMAGLNDLVARARRGKLRASELSDATITVSSLGERGADSLFGVIYPPQVALVGFGSPAMRVRAVDGKVDIRPVVTASLCGDHRVSDGHRGALFLRRIGQLLQQPEAL